MVLFLDLECPPCTDLAVSRQALLESGRELPPIVGITGSPPDDGVGRRPEAP